MTEKTGAGGSAPAPVPAGDAVALAAERKRLADLALESTDDSDQEWRITEGAIDSRRMLHETIDRLAALSREGQADSTGGTTT